MSRTAIPAEMSLQMNAIAIREPGGPDMLVLRSIPRPSPGRGEILIKVEAAGVNRPDTMQRQGAYPPPPGAPETPGLEVAGIVVALGESVTSWTLGDKVCALVAGGGYAEYCIAHESHALPVPEGFSMAEAAALPETFFTVWTNVFERGYLQQGETLLVHGGGSGIGTTAIALGLAFGARVIVTAGSDEKCGRCEALGAIAINYRTQDFVTEVKQLTDGKGANVILDMVGGPYVQKNLSAAAIDGRIVSIAFLQGAVTEINLGPLLLKRLTMTGSTLRPRSVMEKAAIADALRRNVWPLLGPKMRPVIDQTLKLRDAAKAHEIMESNMHFGKIILLP